MKETIESTSSPGEQCHCDEVNNNIAGISTAPHKQQTHDEPNYKRLACFVPIPSNPEGPQSITSEFYPQLVSPFCLLLKQDMLKKQFHIIPSFVRWGNKSPSTAGD